MCGDEDVYRYLPTFLFEQQYEDKEYVIRHLYDACLETSLILGVYLGERFCGMIEVYGYCAPLKKVSVGYRLKQDCWGKGVASEALSLMTAFLFEKTDIKVITASVMPKNEASAAVLEKNGYHRVLRSVPENWGHALPTLADKWMKVSAPEKMTYRFRP